MQLLLLLIAFGGKKKSRDRKLPVDTKSVDTRKAASLPSRQRPNEDVSTIASTSASELQSIEWIPTMDMSVIFDFLHRSLLMKTTPEFKQSFIPEVQYGYYLLTQGNPGFLLNVICNFNHQVHQYLKSEKFNVEYVNAMIEIYRIKFEMRMQTFLASKVEDNVNLQVFFELFYENVLTKENLAQDSYLINIPYSLNTDMDQFFISGAFKDCPLNPVFDDIKTFIDTMRLNSGKLDTIIYNLIDLRNRIMQLLLDTRISVKLNILLKHKLNGVINQLSLNRHENDIVFLYDFSIELLKTDTFDALMLQFQFIEAYTNISNDINIEPSIGYLVYKLKQRGIEHIDIAFTNDKSIYYTDALALFIHKLTSDFDEPLNIELPLRPFIKTKDNPFIALLTTKSERKKFGTIYSDIMAILQIPSDIDPTEEEAPVPGFKKKQFTIINLTEHQFLHIYESFMALHHVIDNLDGLYLLRNAYLNRAIATPKISTHDYAVARIGAIAMQKAMYTLGTDK